MLKAIMDDDGAVQCPSSSKFNNVGDSMTLSSIIGKDVFSMTYCEEGTSRNLIIMDANGTTTLWT